MGKAVGVRSKPTIDMPAECEDGIGGMHFPDFVLGDPKQVVVEIKYCRGGANIFGSCKRDLLKMRKGHSSHAVSRVFIFFDEHPDYVRFSEANKAALQALDPSCHLWLFPEKCNPYDSPQKEAWVKIRANKDKTTA